MNKKILILISTAILSLACERDDNFATKLPPITTTGENTFGALIEGEVYVPQLSGLSSRLAIEFDFPEPPDYFFSVRTTRTSRESSLKSANLWIRQPYVKKVGLYETITASGDYKNTRYRNFFYHDTIENCGTLEGRLEIIHLDTINKIISGTFELQLIKSDQPYDQCLEITSGRFDLKK